MNSKIFGILSVILFLIIFIPLQSLGQENHTVERGETLYSISKEYNVSVSSLKEWNEIESEDLAVGQDLTIYLNEESNEAENTTVEPGNEPQDNSYYTVKNGDTLYRIANAHDMSVEELRELNEIQSDELQVGQQLTVRELKEKNRLPSLAASGDSSPQGKFIAYTLEQDILLTDILTDYHMDEKEFKALNPGAEDTSFSSGETITLLAPPSRNRENPYANNAQLENLGSIAVARYEESDVAQPTTSGDLYNPRALTAAHSNISLGSVVFIENPRTNKGIYVYINDRTSQEHLKLSESAWEALDIQGNDSTVRIYQGQ